MHATTLQNFVKALAGEPKITAKFPEKIFDITQFEDVRKALLARIETGR